MGTRRELKPVDEWYGEAIPAGASHNVQLAVSESYSSMTVRIPIHVRRAVEDGPVVFVTAALHGDEINGTGAVRQLIQDPGFRLLRGTVIFVPVLNILAFERHDRYLPDRRDLNRSFPGSAQGSLARRMARIIFKEIVSRCDYGIDLHTAAVRRTNYSGRHTVRVKRLQRIGLFSRADKQDRLAGNLAN
jgi:predicted deacylase